jgi:hypothetical protein
MTQSGRLHPGIGSQKFKMVAAKPDIPVSQLLYTPHISHKPNVARAMLAIGSRPVSALAVSDASKKRGRGQSSTRYKEHEVEHRCTKEVVCGQHGIKSVSYKGIIRPFKQIAK